MRTLTGFLVTEDQLPHGLRLAAASAVAVLALDHLPVVRSLTVHLRRVPESVQNPRMANGRAEQRLAGGPEGDVLAAPVDEPLVLTAGRPVRVTVDHHAAADARRADHLGLAAVERSVLQQHAHRLLAREASEDLVGDVEHAVGRRLDRFLDRLLLRHRVGVADDHDPRLGLPHGFVATRRAGVGLVVGVDDDVPGSGVQLAQVLARVVESDLAVHLPAAKRDGDRDVHAPALHRKYPRTLPLTLSTIPPPSARFISSNDQWSRWISNQFPSKGAWS